MKEMANYGDKRMTVKEVAEVLGTAESTIRNKVAELMPEIVQNGKPTFLDETQVMQIKNAIVPRDLTLKSKLASVNTDLEMAQKTQEVMAWMADKVRALQAQIDESRPKVEFFDAVTESADTFDMAEVAKVLNIPGFGRNNLFAFLRGKKVFMSDNSPYQTYIDRGYFKMVESSWETPSGLCHVNLKPVVYQKGLDFIRKIIMENN